MSKSITWFKCQSINSYGVVTVGQGNSEGEASDNWKIASRNESAVPVPKEV